MSECSYLYEYASTIRCIEQADRCPACGGSGYLTYENAASWRGGPGEATATEDVCNQCWGSGNRHRPWPSWKEREALLRTYLNREEGGKEEDKWGWLEKLADSAAKAVWDWLVQECWRDWKTPKQPVASKEPGGEKIVIEAEAHQGEPDGKIVLTVRYHGERGGASVG